jgi:hypothetical protein
VSYVAHYFGLTHVRNVQEELELRYYRNLVRGIIGYRSYSCSRVDDVGSVCGCREVDGLSVIQPTQSR